MIAGSPASDGAAIITTDGAGQASVDVTVVGACEGKAAGEVVNVDGICGGYNLQWAWSSGTVAGKNAAKQAG